MSSLAALMHDDADTIVVSGSKRVGKEKSWFNRFAHGCDGADKAAVTIARGGRNAYCKHALHDGQLNDKRRPQCTANHFLASRTFFIDIDAAHGSGYATIMDAANAFKKTHQELRRLGLPKPNLFQNTGGGLQAAWVIETPLPADEWKRINRILFLIAAKTGLALDLNLHSIDKAVRYCGPSFQNVNHGSPRATEVVWFDDTRIPNNKFVDVLTQHGQLRAVPSNNQNVGRPKAFNDRFKTGEDHKLDLSLILDECEVLKEAVLTGGADHGYEQWTRIISLAAKNNDEEYGLLLAHEISKSHPDYEPDQVEGKFYSFRDRKKYPTCAGSEGTPGFHDLFPNLCTKCKYYNKVNSPAGIQGKLAAVAQAKGEASETVILDGVKILEGEYFNSNAGVRRKKRGEEETNPVIWPRVSINNVTLKALDVNNQVDIISFDIASNTGDWNRHIEIMAAQLHSHTTAARALSEQQSPLPDRQHKSVQEALVHWLHDLRSRGTRSTKYTRLGWTADKTSFVLGSTVYHADGSHEPIMNADQGLRAFDCKGDVHEYRDIANTVFGNETRAEAHCFMAASLGAPLIELVGAAGMAINYYSTRSGHGKTTLSQMAGSLWGTPRDMTFTLDDTENSIMRRTAFLNNLPALYDEMRVDQHSQEKVIRMIFRLNSGTEKSRLQADSTIQDRGQWRTLMLFSTNYTFLDLVKNDKRLGGEAAIARVLDFALPPLPVKQHKMVAAISIETAKLESCNAWIGHNWIDFVVTHRQKIIQRIHTTFKFLMQECSKRGGSDTFSRNHCFAGAVMVVAAKMASDNGIMPLNAQLVIDAVTTALQDAQASRSKTYFVSDPLTALRDFVHHHEAHTLVVHKVAARKGAVFDIDERIQFRTPVLVEVNQAEKVIYVALNRAERWFQQEGYVTKSIMDGLEQYRVPAPRSLGAGTRLHNAPIEVFAVPAEGIFAGMISS